MNQDVPSPIDLADEADARRWADESMGKRPYRQDLFRLIADEIKQRSIKSVLELGSGPGFLANTILEVNPSLQYTALDNSLAMHELAKARLGACAQKVNFVVSSFLDSNWYTNLLLVDAVVSMQAVHEIRHKSKTDALFNQIQKVLVPGGTFLYCDHVCDEAGMSNNQLFMSEQEQRQHLENHFIAVTRLSRQGSLALWRAIGN